MDSPTNLVFFLGVPAVLILSERYTPLVLSCCAVAVLSLNWEALVTERVPEPYLDEVFHIPQAQAYCNGDFSIWDPKLTTPPGLYLVSAALLSLFECSVEALRTVNTLALSLLILPLFACRNALYKVQEQNWEAAHTALNICLFPPLFFFSGLYYTDVLSTLLVFLSYGVFLCDRSSFKGGVWSYILGLAALGMRQTNVFWVAVYLAGMEWVRTCKKTTWVTKERHAEPSIIKEWGNRMEDWSHGLVHDPKLGNASVTDFFLCGLSIGVAAIFSPILLITRIWPYIAVLISFAGFVFWNGGVVLGDKSNHVATIHLPQMLYFWPFIVFFSFPVLYPDAMNIIAVVLPASLAKRFNLTSSIAKPNPFKSLAFAAVSVLIATTIVHFNTGIHPFTLADNRHYMFYIFRYTILRHPLAKYALSPFYILAGWLVLRSLGGMSPAQEPTRLQIRSKQPSPIDNGIAMKEITHDTDTSFVLIWLLSTTLSLITAPLVEPRYFIIPWIVWRLHVPSRKSTSFVPTAAKPPLEFPLPAASDNGKASQPTKLSGMKGELGKVETHDLKLYLETLWFIAINAVTGYVFLYRGFSWPQEEGRVQRFMW